MKRTGLLLVLVLWGCAAPAQVARPTVAPSATARPTPEPTAPPSATPTAEIQPTATQRPNFVSRASMGDAWPLTVDRGVLSCIGGSVVIATGGAVYALNGEAKQEAGAHGWLDIGPIWADDVGGLKKDIAPLIERGLQLCA